MSLLVKARSCLWMLLLSYVAILVILEGGLRPPSFSMSLLLWPCLVLQYVGTLVILEGGLRPPYFLMNLLVGDFSCLWMLLLSFVDTTVILEGGPLTHCF